MANVIMASGIMLKVMAPFKNTCSPKIEFRFDENLPKMLSQNILAIEQSEVNFIDILRV